MNENIVCQIDDFAPDAIQVRDAVIKGGFSTVIGPDGAEYKDVSQHPVPQWYELVAKAVRCAIVPQLSCFRLNLHGDLPHSWIHSDQICAKYASVLFLNPPDQCQGGTAFWQHKQSGDRRLLNSEQIAAKGMEPQAYCEMMSREWKTLRAWERWHLAEMQFNRFIAYPTYLFHSRYPFEGFGRDSHDGRLIWAFFYDKKGESLCA